MQISFIVVGKTNEDYLKTGIAEYSKRVGRYIKYEYVEIPYLKNTKNLSEKIQKNKEGECILKLINKQDFVVLLDDKGKEFDSIAFSNMLQSRMNQSIKKLVFVVGGAYGFSEEVYNRSNSKLSISRMTFSHQIIRLIFLEQLYRAFTILNNEPYHHQ